MGWLTSLQPAQSQLSSFKKNLRLPFTEDKVAPEQIVITSTPALMDPFSIIAGTVGICDVCWRVFQYLKDVREASGTIQGEIDALQRELSLLRNVNEALEKTCAKDQGSLDHKEDVQLLWHDVNQIRQGCKEYVEDLGKLLEEKFGPMIQGIIGKNGARVTSRLDGLKKGLRRHSKNEDLVQFRLRLANYQNSLQVLLAALNISYSYNIRTSTENLTESVQRLGYELQSKITLLRNEVRETSLVTLSESPSSATAIVSLLSFNKHFDLPRPVSSIFVGRSNLLKELGDSIFSTELLSTQRRFVIYGLGGSGKTEFCCKFAQDHQQLFWGVFWIDATSPATVKSTMSRIARLGGVEPNAEAAKSWLSSLNQPWLLLIENANGDGSGVNLTDLFPEGQRGTVLITTRDASYRTHGTVGICCLHFEKMDEHEANELLLRAASIEGRDVTIMNEATTISETLGALPLALVHAGKAILEGLCTLGDYVAYFWRFLERVRRNTFDDNDSNMRVYSTYEILFLSLENRRDGHLEGHIAAGDGVELLKVFSFLSGENIQLNILIKAVENYEIQQNTQTTQKPDIKELPLKKENTAPLLTWSSIYRKTTLLLNFEVLKYSPPVLPAVLRDFSIDRLRKALALLAKLGLITYHGTSNHYSMHPLVHIWSRYRPEMKLREQAVWCQAAATTLSNCILLPPLGENESDLKLRLQLIPHVIHVLMCQEEIDTKFQEQRKKRNKLLPFFGNHKFNRTDAQMFAKFSMVYAEGGMWSEAESLQRPVKEFICAILGDNHPVAINIVLALSGSVMNQTRANEAADLQEQALRACLEIYGKEHIKTLMVMKMLANSYVFGGRFQAALNLYEKAIAILTSTKGADDEDTLRTVDDLGRLMLRYQRNEEAEALHEKAATGLEQVLGETNLDTITAKAGLAVAKLYLGGDRLPAALELIDLVCKERKKQLGKEHPWTLLAISDCARIKAALGDTDEAEEMLVGALTIAKRNLGQDHQGVLASTAHLANIYVKVQRYQEAEDILMYVTNPDMYKYSVRDDGEHPDRIAALWYLMNCFLAQKKNREALEVNYRLYEALANLGGQGLGKNHVFATRTLQKRTELEASLKSASSIFEPAEDRIETDTG